MNSRHIIIDIGHARMTGASAHGLHEHEEMARFAPLLAAELQEHGFRTTIIDYPELSNEEDLVATVKEANRLRPDFILSLHMDCSDNEKARGAHVCYTSTKGERMQLRIHTIIRRANARNREEHPGMHCCYCAKQATCAKLRSLALPLASRYAELSIPEELHPSRITSPELMAHCLDCAKVLKEWVESVNFHAIDMAVNGEEIPGYKLTSRAGRRTIPDALAAYGAVKDSMSLEDFISCCGSVSLEELGNKVSATAPRGQKQKSKDELVTRLTEDGIITTGAPSKILKRIK